MSNFTFEGKKSKKQQKERIEWLRTWCVDTNDDTLPRVALIGDSITEQYSDFVAEALKGVAIVDRLTTSYSITSPFYKSAVEGFLQDSQYAVIHYNYGLHAYCVTDDEYENAYRELLKTFLQHGKVIVTTTTTVLEKPDLLEESEPSKTVVRNRNERALKLAKEFSLPVDDLFAVCQTLPKEGKSPDGIHFLELGCKALAASVTDNLKKLL